MGLIFTYKKTLLSQNSEDKIDILNMDLKTTFTHDLSITKEDIKEKIKIINLIEDVSLDISIGDVKVPRIDCDIGIYKDIFDDTTKTVS